MIDINNKGTIGITELEKANLVSGSSLTTQEIQ